MSNENITLDSLIDSLSNENDESFIKEASTTTEVVLDTGSALSIADELESVNDNIATNGPNPNWR